MLTRALIVLLLVLNLGVAAWWLLRPTLPAPPAPTPPAGVARLQLVSEVVTRPASPVAANPAPAAEVATPGEPPAALRCFAFGPFANADAANAASARIASRTERRRVRTEAAVATGGRWNVLLPPLPDRAAAQAMAERIDAAGFKDYYVIGEGASANGIALGRFGSEESARRHQTALQAAGFAVQVQTPDAAAASRAWLDVAIPAQADPSAMRATLSAQEARPADCEMLG